MTIKNHNDMKLIMESWREFQYQCEGSSRVVSLNEAGMSSAAMGRGEFKKPSQKSMCALMKAVMTYVHQNSDYAGPKMKAALKTLKGNKDWKKKFSAFIDLASKEPDKGKQLLWRSQIVGATYEVVDALIAYVIDEDEGGVEIPPLVKKYLKEQGLETLKKVFGNWLRKYVLKKAAIHTAAVVAGVGTGGLSLTISAAEGLRDLFSAVSCSEELNDYADKLVGTSGVRMKKLIPDVEGASKGYAAFAAAVFS